MHAAATTLQDSIEHALKDLGRSPYLTSSAAFIGEVLQKYGDHQMDLRLSQLTEQLVQRSKPDVYDKPATTGLAPAEIADKAAGVSGQDVVEWQAHRRSPVSLRLQ